MRYIPTLMGLTEKQLRMANETSKQPLLSNRACRVLLLCLVESLWKIEAGERFASAMTQLD